CAVNAWIGASTAKNASYPKSLPGSGSEILHAPASTGCSQPRKRAPKWGALTRKSRPKSHNHCDEVLARAAATVPGLLPTPIRCDAEGEGALDSLLDVNACTIE